MTRESLVLLVRNHGKQQIEARSKGEASAIISELSGMQGAAWDGRADGGGRRDHRIRSHGDERAHGTRTRALDIPSPLSDPPRP